MAIISKIQDYKYILVGIILICILTFLFEVINPNLNALTGGQNLVGEVNGSSLEYEAFKKEYDLRENEMKIAKGVSSLTEQEQNDLKNQIWSQFLMKNVVTANMDKLGLAISPKEIVEITQGQNIDPSLKQIPAFLNQMGQFDPMAFKNFTNSLNIDDPGTAPGTRKKQWLEFEKQILDNRKMSKFNSIIENALYVPKWMSDFDSKFFATNADVNYVVLPYTTVDREKINVDDKELETFFNENKNKYIPITPTVKLAYVTFPLKPSMADSTEIFTKFSAKVDEMRASTNDTTFFKVNGDRGFDETYYKQSDLADHPKFQDLFSAPSKSIVGPYIDKESVKATKILDKKNISDSVYVKAISISFQDVAQNEAGQKQRMKLIDSIFYKLDTLGQDFDQLAAQYSSDRGQGQAVWITKQERIWEPEIFTQGGVKKYFKSFAMIQRDGTVKIMKVINYPANIPAIRIGEISTAYAPSTGTQQAVYNQAVSFISKVKTGRDMEKLAKTNPLIQFAYITKDNTSLDKIEGNGKEAIRWAFESKSNDLSSMLQIGSNYVYCGNLGLRSKDNIKFEDVKEDMMAECKAEKAFKQIAAKLEGANINDIATKNNTTVQTLAGLSFSNSTINQMPEPAMVAVTSALGVNKLSKAFKGSGGVYRVIATKINPSTVTPAEELNTKTQINSQFKNLQGLIEGMLNRYNVVDNRVNLF